MAITLDGTSGVTAPLFDGPLDAADLTGDVAAARITGALNATGSAPIYACRAWVNFNGTGTVAIRASGNVTSITDNGTGDYTINFAIAMPDANYSPVFSGELMTIYGTGSVAATTTAYRMDSRVPSTNALVDRVFIYAAIFR
jgi:hypothetical protein